MKSGDFGFLNIDKPLGITAHDVVARVRRGLKIKQVGHGGTLDPLATGVLPVAIGKATRLLRFLESDKVYLATILLGTRTTTDDMAGEVLKIDASAATSISQSDVTEALRSFIGNIQQRPPMYSAVHLDGKRMYAMARAGTLPSAQEIPLRNVTVYSIDVLDYAPPVVQARIKCGAGTYIRSIARDLGEMLGCGGCLQSLLREQAGPFHVTDSVSLDDVSPAISLVPPEDALTLPRFVLSEEQHFKIIRGQSFDFDTAEVQGSAEYVLAMHHHVLTAVCKLNHSESDASSVRIQPEVVLENVNESK